jgi:RNA polymerase sigma-70 factor (ECF subfamily)
VGSRFALLLIGGKRRQPLDQEANNDSSADLDATLLARISDGDRQALAELFGRYARYVRSIAYKVLRDEAEADDLLQDAFLHINRKSGIFDRSKGTARAWIAQVAYRRAIERRRRLSSRHFYTQVSLDNDALDIPGPRIGGAHYEQSLEGRFGKKAVKDMFNALSVNQKETLRLFFFEGYTLDEIALEMRQSVGNIKNHYYRGLDRLRRMLGNEP